MLNNFKKKIIDKFPSLQRYVRYNYGLLLEGLTECDYIFGGINGITKKILMPSGQWTDFLPFDEKQQGRRVETMACTCFSLLNVLETLAKFKGYGNWNKADRFTAKLSGTGASGNLQSRVLDSVRKNNGMVNEEVWPSNIDEFDWNEFYAPIPKDVQDKGITFVNDYEVGYEAVWSTPAALKEALKYSPLYIAGFAWSNSGGLYRSYGNPNHAFTLVGYVEGQYWLAYDSYSPFLKKLAWDYKIYYPKVITLNKRGEVYNTNMIKNLFDKGIKFLFRAEAHGELYTVEPNQLVKVEPQEFLNINIREKITTKELLPVNEKYFNNLLV